MRNSIEQYLRGIYTNRKPTLVAVALWFVAFAVYWDFPIHVLGSDLAGNLIAESSGIVITVGLIQWLFEMNDKRKTKSARFQAYNEAVRLHMMVCSTWASIVRCTILTTPEIGEDLFSKKYIQEVQQHFDINGDAGQLPATTWKHSLSIWYADLKRRIDKLIQRYQTTIDPELLELLGRLEEMPTLNIWGRMSSLQLGPPYAPNGLLFVQGFEERDIPLLRRLHNCLVRLSKEFETTDGYIAPYDITFAKEIIEIGRNNVAPLRGTCRR